MKYLCGPKWDERVVTINVSGRAGIMLSGGVDSWILYNLLLHEDADLDIFFMTRKDGHDWVGLLENLLPPEEYSKVIQVEEKSDDPAWRLPSTCDYIVEHYNIDQLYYGINHTPPIEHFPEFEGKGKPLNRPWRIDNWKGVFTPFYHVYKYHTIDLAHQFNIDISKCDTCYDPNVEWDQPCGVCWGCRERQWGHDQLK